MLVCLTFESIGRRKRSGAYGSSDGFTRHTLRNQEQASLAVDARRLALPDSVFLIGWGEGPPISGDPDDRPGAVELFCIAVVFAFRCDRAVSANGGGPFEITSRGVPIPPHDAAGAAAGVVDGLSCAHNATQSSTAPQTRGIISLPAFSHLRTREGELRT